MASCKRSEDDLAKRQKTNQKTAAIQLAKYGTQRQRKVEGETFLERRSVSAPVERDYLNRFTAFLRWSQLARMPIQSNEEIDETLTLMMNEMLSKDRPEQMARSISPPSDIGPRV